MTDDDTTPEQMIELVMDQFHILYMKAAADAGWDDIPPVVDDAMAEAYRLLRAALLDTASPTEHYRQPSAD
jgi:hypothetical protein